MKVTITYHRINVVLAVIALFNLANVVASWLYWPTVPAFPELIDGHPGLSFLVLVVLVRSARRSRFVLGTARSTTKSK
ncbi:MAG: hypothetical protein ABSH49_01880 [Bryobacteraceae bacterium]